MADSSSTALTTSTKTDLLDPRASAFINGWQSVEQSLQQQKRNQLPRLPEQAGPVALVLNLSRIPVAETWDLLGSATEDVKKNHPGVRTTFLILQMMHPGWSSVSASDGKEPINNNSKGGGGKQKSEPKDKLSSAYGDHVLMHSFALLNQRGTYTRGARSKECFALSPGMIMSTKVWGNKFALAFKEQTADMEVFDMGFVQFGLKSITSTSMTSGMMLEVKTIRKISDEVNPSAFRLLKSTIVPTSLQESAIMKSRFADGSHLTSHQPLKTTMMMITSSSASSAVSSPTTKEDGADESLVVEPPLAAVTAEKPEGLCQDMIKGNISSTVSLVRATPSPAHGVFAYGADDRLRFHLNDSIADLPCVETLLVKFDEAVFFGLGGGDGGEADKKEWVAKMMNVAVTMRAMEMFIAVDTYKAKDSGSGGADGAADGGSKGEQSMDCYVRIDTSVMTAFALASTPPTPAASLPFVADALAGIISPHHHAAFVSSSGITLVVDLRCLTKKKQQQSTADSKRQIRGSVLHKTAGWEKAHCVHVFFEERLVHCFFVPVSPAGADGTSRMVLEAIKPNVADYTDEFEVEGSATLLAITTTSAEAAEAASETTEAVSEAADASSGGGGASKKRKRNATQQPSTQDPA
jgi:hypothetical protein